MEASSSLPEGYTYKPLPDYLKWGNSKIHGLGIFAAEDLEKDHLITWGPTHIIMDEELIRTPLGGIINHSYNPNVKLVQLGDKTRWYYKTVRDIAKDEELTLDYSVSICGFQAGRPNLEIQGVCQK